MRLLERLKRGLKHHGHHFIFGVSILSLTLLTAWWSVFINKSIEKEQSYHRQHLELALKFFSIQLGMDKGNRPEPGVVKEDDRFEIGACGTAGTAGTAGQTFVRPLLPLWPKLCIKVREPVLTKLEKDFRRKKLMVAGESGLLVLLILVSIFLLYEFIQAERRSTREMEEFWGRVTHEIKTPITGVKAFLQSLKNQSLAPDQLPRFVGMALKQVEKQEQLAENILAGYGLRSRKAEYVPNLKDMNFNECIRDYFDNHAIHLTDARVSLHLGTGEDLLVQVDCHILRVVLDNIVDNALRYCSPGLVLEVRVSLWDRRVMIAIRDNGPGFPPGLSEKIFNAYKYPDQELPGKGHGSGMGLYISRHLVEKMGGRLEAHSRGEGQGAEFRLFLDPANP